MSTITQTLYLTPFRFKHHQEVTWMLSGSNYKASEHGALIASVERKVTVELPENFNPVAAEVASLQVQKTKALEAYQRTVAELNDRLSKLLAITNEPAALPTGDVTESDFGEFDDAAGGAR
jgi:hypothetical protein